METEMTTAPWHYIVCVCSYTDQWVPLPLEKMNVDYWNGPLFVLHILAITRCILVYELQELAGSQVSSLLHPVLADQLPTYHRLNKFTRAFQVICDAYGVACYKEVNPGKIFHWSNSLKLRTVCCKSNKDWLQFFCCNLSKHCPVLVTFGRNIQGSPHIFESPWLTLNINWNLPVRIFFSVFFLRLFKNWIIEIFVWVGCCAVCVLSNQ